MIVSSKIYRIASKLSNIEYKGDLKCKHIAVALYNNKIISPVGYNYSRSKFLNKKIGTLHAEMYIVNYIVNLYNSNKGRPSGRRNKILRKIRNIDILVIRLSNTDDKDVKNSRPCYQCIQNMRNIGINKVYYTTDSNIVVEKVKDITSTHLCVYDRHHI